jgi:hypothetical protein
VPSKSKAIVVAVGTVISLLGLSTLAAENAPPSEPNFDPARLESARQIISGCQSYTKWAKSFIAQASTVTNQAKTLSGSARRFQSTVAPKMQRLSGAKLAAAKKMYQSDLRQFAEHASEYRAHTDKVRGMYGQCEASRRAYEQNRLNYTLHCLQWHMDNVPPPHVCLEVSSNVTEARQAAGMANASMKRMVDAEASLAQQEERLKGALKDSSDVDAKTRKQHDLNLHEQDLVAEFARLQEEYKQLTVESSALKSSGVKVPVQSVRGKVTH